MRQRAAARGAPPRIVIIDAGYAGYHCARAWSDGSRPRTS